MSSAIDRPEEITDANRIDYIIGLLKAADEAVLCPYIAQLHVAELATLLESLPPELRHQLWQRVPAENAGETLVYLGDEVRNSIIEAMDGAELVAATGAMEVADLVEVMDELSDDVNEAVLKSLDADRRHRLETTLTFPEGSAGRLMSSDVISVRKDVTLSVVLRYLRRLKPLPRHTNALMVIDDLGCYVGKLSIASVVTEHPDSLVADVMQESTSVIQSNATEHDVAVLFERRDLVSVAVVNELGELLGRITVDDAVDIMLAEADKALLASAGLNEDEDLFAPVVISAKRRALWLGINLITVFLAAWVIGRFEEALDKIVALAVLLPVVASMGGIAGSQTLTLTIRGLALGQVSGANLRWLGSKELMVGLLNGIGWSVIVALVTYVWFQNVGIALIISAAMILNLVAAACSGVLIPVILTRMGIDPALSGAVVLTTVTDIVGFLSFLGLATIFLL